MIEPSHPGTSLRRQCDMYLVATIDRFSRYVLAWQLSNTLDGWFCLDALHQALLVDHRRSSIPTRVCSSPRLACYRLETWE